MTALPIFADDEPRRVHPDDMVRRCFWSADPRVPSGSRTSGTILRYAPQCHCGSTTWAPKTVDGHGKNRRRLPAPVPVCVRCGGLWETWNEDDHLRTGVQGSGITRRGRWCRYIHVKGYRPPGTSTEARIFGELDLAEMLALRSIARTLYRSPRWWWHAHVYFPYCLRFGAFRGQGGHRALTAWAAEGWPHAPIAWNPDKVLELITAGREEWARRLALADIIEGGTWWRGEGNSQ